MTKIDYFICPAEELTFVPFQFQHCETPPAFISVAYELPGIFKLLGVPTLMLNKFQIHGSVLVLFASFIAPFGGFFASGFKRAFQIKVPYDCSPKIGLRRNHPGARRRDGPVRLPVPNGTVSRDESLLGRFRVRVVHPGGLPDKLVRGDASRRDLGATCGGAGADLRCPSSCAPEWWSCLTD